MYRKTDAARLRNGNKKAIIKIRKKRSGEWTTMKKENDLGRDEIGALVWRTALPSMLAQFVSVLYSIVDRMGE